MRLALALTTILAAAPASAAFKCPAKGGGAWRELQTEHFVLDTDLGTDRARVLLKKLETLHAMELQALVGEVVEIPGHLRVVAFADPRDFVELSGSQYVGGYYRVTDFGPTIVIPVEGFEANARSSRTSWRITSHASSFRCSRSGSPRVWRFSSRRSRPKATTARSWDRTSSAASAPSAAVSA